MKTHNIEQGSAEWHSLRKGKITASKVPILMGLSPYQTPRQLWEEELGFREPQKSTKHMEDGLSAEPEARKYFSEKTGVIVKPDVVFSDEDNKFMASLDGINENRTVMVEIKKNNKTYHEMARNGKIIDFHQAQMQWQMFCEGEHIQNCHYLSWRKDDPVIVVVARDDEFILHAKIAGLEFLRMIEDLEEPALNEEDYEDVSLDSYTQNQANKYLEFQRLANHYNDLAENCKKNIIEATKDRNVRGNGWKLTKYSTKGRLDYDGLFHFHRISESEQNTFRKPSTTSYRITQT